MKSFTTIILFLLAAEGFSQNKPGTSFYGNTPGNASACPATKNALTDADINNMITEMLRRYGLRNRFVVIPCAQIDNCQAVLHNNRPYILYNTNFLQTVKRLNFREAVLPASEKDWQTLTILAHELGHHLNNHLNNPLPDAKDIDMELEADETAGFIIYLMGGTLAQAQLAFSDIPETASYTHPGRQKRLEAVGKGWNDAFAQFKTKDPIQGPIAPETNVPKSVRIGSQVWTSENLNTDKFRDGSVIPEAKTKEEWKDACTAGQPAWCWYNNDPDIGKKYGRLYNWYAVKDTRGLAPIGYHIATKEDWDKLELFSGSNASERLMDLPVSLKSKVTNTTGFTGLQGGARSPEGVFEYLGENGRWWCANDETGNIGFLSGREMTPGVGVVSKLNLNKWYGLSVRCVKDEMIYLPPAFTPNGDGINDLAKPNLAGIKTLKGFSIYNRWGQRVFFTNKENEGWDGNMNGNQQDTGNYSWVLEFIAGDGLTITEKGTITLIR